MVVYRHRRLDINEIFYIGIGKSKSRAYQIRSRNEFWKNITNKTDYSVEIIAENLDVEDAKELECFLIQEYGRKDLGLGQLVNLTDGGDGCINFSDITKNKISQSLKGKFQSEETKLKRSISLKNTWKCPELRKLKSIQTTKLNKLGIIGTKGKSSHKKGKPFDGDKIKLSLSLKEYYKNNKPYNFIEIDDLLRIKILNDYKNGVTKFKLHKTYNLGRCIIERIVKTL